MTQRDRLRAGRRPLALEPLEDRLLLTAASAIDGDGAPAAEVSLATLADAGGSIRLVELERGGESRDTSRDIALAELPSAVASALAERLPGAKLESAETDFEHGVQVYDVVAKTQGGRFEVSLSGDGRVLEVEKSLATSDVPRKLEDWIARTFPGASVVEAVELEHGAYELVIETPAHETLEATLVVSQSPEAGPAVAPTDGLDVGLLETEQPAAAEDAGATTTESPKSSGARERDRVEQAAPASVTAAESTTPARQSAEGKEAPWPEAGHDAVNSSGGAVTAAAAVPSPDAPQATRETESSELPSFDAALLAAVAQPLPVAWLSQLAPELCETLPLNLAAIEQGFQRFLDDVDALSDELATAGDAWKLTPVALLAAAELWWTTRAIGDARRTRGAALLAAAGIDSTWTRS
jgi:hypothetical protein